MRVLVVETCPSESTMTTEGAGAEWADTGAGAMRRYKEEEDVEVGYEREDADTRGGGGCGMAKVLLLRADFAEMAE